MINFNGVDLGNYFIVNKITRSILPLQQTTTQSIPQRAGSFFVGNKDQSKSIAVDITVIGTDGVLANLRDQLDEIAGKLSVTKPAPLIFDDEIDKTYYAIIEGDSNLDEIVAIGKGTITFLCPNPHKYETEIQAVSSLGEVSPTVTGNVETYPTVECTITVDAAEYVIEHVAKAQKVRLISPFVIGDTISINFNTGKILINGLLRMTTYDFTISRWFTLDPGANVLTVSDDTTIKWRPTWR